MIQAKCGTCRKPMFTFEVTCVQCGELRWAYESSKPVSYLCQRCRSGAGAAKREAGRRLRPKGSPGLGGKR